MANQKMGKVGETGKNFVLLAGVGGYVRVCKHHVILKL